MDGLPVKRPAPRTRGHVVAASEELDRWVRRKSFPKPDYSGALASITNAKRLQGEAHARVLELPIADDALFRWAGRLVLREESVLGSREPRGSPTPSWPPRTWKARILVLRRLRILGCVCLRRCDVQATSIPAPSVVRFERHGPGSSRSPSRS
jgi:hypothetical protein